MLLISIPQFFIIVKKYVNKYEYNQNTEYEIRVICVELEEFIHNRIKLFPFLLVIFAIIERHIYLILLKISN